MFWHVGLSALLAVGAQAGGVGDLVAEGYFNQRSPRALESRLADKAADHVVVRRQLTSDVQLNADGSVNMTAWDIEVNAACTAALSKIAVATNPSGTCTCYNLPALNNATGTFEADLRLFRLSEPRDDFAGIPAEDVQVSLAYNGASVSPVSTTTAQTLVAPRQNQNLKLLQSYLFIGQVDANKMSAEMNMAQLEAIVMPIVTLSATNSLGRVVSTNISSNEAVFVAGAFSTTVTLSSTGLAQVAVDKVVAGLANGTVAFVVPGVNLLIFPVGLIIAGSWFVIGISFIGFGFFERVQYRESYRRRAAIASKGSTMKRI